MILPATQGRAEGLLSFTTSPRLEIATSNEHRHATGGAGRIGLAQSTRHLTKASKPSL